MQTDIRRGPWSLLRRFQAPGARDAKLSAPRGCGDNNALGNENMTVPAS
jgi:hypothetical protein